MTRRGAILSIAALVAAIAYLATGWTVVAPGEVVVVRRLGRVLPAAWAPGPHLGCPWGIDRTTRVRLDAVRRLPVGLVDVPGPDDDPGAGEYLTGDLNLLRARGIVQYRVADPVAYVLHSADSEPLLTRLAEAALTRALARRDIDSALRSGRAQVAADVTDELTRAIDAYGLGLAVLGVSLTDTRPPMEVAADFAAAQSAQSEHDRRKNEALTYQATTLPKANAQAMATTEQARAKADRAVLLARSRSARFVALLDEANRDRALTIRRLYRDALRELLPRIQRKLVTPEEPIDLSIVR